MWTPDDVYRLVKQRLQSYGIEEPVTTWHGQVIKGREQMRVVNELELPIWSVEKADAWDDSVKPKPMEMYAWALLMAS